MYSGWLLTNYSGQIIGAHQKFNRVAYRQLKLLQPELQLPALKLIQHFEGRNGPDGLKLKSPGHNEPHHFYDPFDPRLHRSTQTDWVSLPGAGNSFSSRQPRAGCLRGPLG